MSTSLIPSAPTAPSKSPAPPVPAVTQRVFDDWSSHQNWGLANLPFRYPWVFYLDADERAQPGARRRRPRKRCNVAGDRVAFRVRRRDFWGERWLKHVVASSFYLRLFRPQKMRYERLVNPLSLPDGPVGELTGYLDHYPFSKGVTTGSTATTPTVRSKPAS